MDVLCRIFSWLPMRDVARASASCSALLRVWARHPRLTFDEGTLRLRLPAAAAAAEEQQEDLLLSQQQQRGEHAAAFVRLVDAILMSPRRDTAYLEELTLRFAYLRSQHAPCVDRWVRSAAATCCRRLTVDLLPHGCYNPDRLCYEFPCSLLPAAALEHLHLRQGALDVDDTPGLMMRLSNLETLVLARVRVTGEGLERLLSSCHKLRSLDLERCEDLDYLNLSPARGLTSLIVTKCWKVDRIIGVCDIESLRFSGHNLLPPILGGSSASAAAPLLRLDKVASASFDLAGRGGGTAAAGLDRLDLLLIARAMPGLQSLSLRLPPLIRVAVGVPPPQRSSSLVFRHLRRVELSLRSPPRRPGTRNDDDLLFMYPFLDAAPALEALSLQLTRFVDTLDDDDGGGRCCLFRKHPGLPHRSLRDVRITGFDADHASVELVLHIIDRAATALRTVSLQPTWADDQDLIHDMADEIELIRRAIARHIAPAVPLASAILLQVK
ncbi:unnamed protein product [Urochloa humidicola]